jgi:predicted alpha/beta superfamily hydrolase
MKNIIRTYLLIILISLIKPSISNAQDINIKLGFADSIQSVILSETRKIIIHLPDDYDSSKKTYPVLYLLDGTRGTVLQTLSVLFSLRYNKSIPDLIVVAIANTDRDRDMMPLSTKSYTVPTPGAQKFLSFIGNELIPHIEKGYSTNEQRILRGKSLSGLFTLYAFLTKPTLFNIYIGCSAGWLGDMNDYFVALTDRAFQNPDQFQGKIMFMANSLIDSYDPDHTIHRQMLEFSKKIKTLLGNRVRYEYVTYENYGHIPYPSFYDGLKYVFKVN